MTAFVPLSPPILGVMVPSRTATPTRVAAPDGIKPLDALPFRLAWGLASAGDIGRAARPGGWSTRPARADGAGMAADRARWQPLAGAPPIDMHRIAAHG